MNVSGRYVLKSLESISCGEEINTLEQQQKLKWNFIIAIFEIVKMLRRKRKSGVNE